MEESIKLEDYSLGQPGQKQNPISKIIRAKRVGRMAQVAVSAQQTRSPKFTTKTKIDQETDKLKSVT
jgi:hypothetical protein